MKYIQFTYVDFATRIPVSKEPAKRGPDIPEGITPTFAIESSYGQAPVLYGIAEDEFEPEEWMVEVAEGEFYAAFKQELKERARKKRKMLEQGGVDVGGNIIQTTIEDQNRVSNMVAGLNVTPEATQVDFEYAPGQWTVITREEAIAIGQAVFNHVQLCFTWCKDVHAKVDAIATLEDALPVVEEIAFANSETLYPAVVEPVV